MKASGKYGVDCFGVWKYDLKGSAYKMIPQDYDSSDSRN